MRCKCRQVATGHIAESVVIRMEPIYTAATAISWTFSFLLPVVIGWSSPRSNPFSYVAPHPPPQVEGTVLLFTKRMEVIAQSTFLGQCRRREVLLFFSRGVRM